ncbi:MAG: glycosyltransferase [Acidimicrobiia bacterium]
MSPTALSVVVPAFDESARLGDRLPPLLDALPAGTEVIVVDDGSTDNTADLAEKILAPYPDATVLRRPHGGKGAAVRAGILEARGDAIAFMDADGATNIAALHELLAALDHADVAIGSRRQPGASVRSGEPSRAAIAWVGNTLVRSMTRLPYRDTQCGFKAFRAPAARTLFSLSVANGFSFDVELLLLARKLGLQVTEIPVEWTSVPGSHVRPVADSIGVALDVAQMAYRWRGPRAQRAAAQLATRAQTGNAGPTG